jgi:hypothetical protein
MAGRDEESNRNQARPSRRVGIGYPTVQGAVRRSFLTDG